MYNKTCIILRGCPGSGKSTFAETIADKNTVICCADDYFVQNGEYKFDGSKIKAAHKYCTDKFAAAMLLGNNIIVANTNIQEWEFQHYFDAAEQSGYRVFVVVLENRHGNKNIHNCPAEKVQLMAHKLEDSIRLI
jgi:predicted kinase